MAKPPSNEVRMRYRGMLLPALMALLALAWFPAGAARAEKEKQEQAKDAKKEDGEHKKPSDPPIFTPRRLDLALWTLVVFLLLFFVLSKYAWGPMLEGLKKREENIRSALEDAQRAREE